MNNQVGIISIILFWLAIAVYDVIFSLPNWSFVLVYLMWGLTAIVSYFIVINAQLVPTFFKFLALIVFSYVVFIAYGQFLNISTEIFALPENRIAKIIFAFIQSIVTCALISIVTCVPMAKIFGKSFSAWVLVSCIPTISYIANRLFENSSWLAKSIYIVEISAILFFTWLAVFFVIRTITNRSIGTPANAASP